MLPAKLRYWLFDTLSVQPMRYVSAVPTKDASGLTREVYEMIREDFFKNGSLTSRSRVPQLMAAIWTGGREAMLVQDKVDRTTKDAMSAVLSQMNECPYCEDMLISLVHAAGDHEAASGIYNREGINPATERLQERLQWASQAVSGDDFNLPRAPFTSEQMPEVIGTLMGMSDINRFSHVVMDGSAVAKPMGLDIVKNWALRLFGNELKVTRRLALLPGRALSLLPAAELPADMQWARSNPRVADAMARWTAAVEREAEKVISPEARRAVIDSLASWHGEQMPLSGKWIEEAVVGLSEEDAVIARFAIVVGKASYRITDQSVADVMGEAADEERFIRILAWSSFTAARRVAQIVAARVQRVGVEPEYDTQAVPAGEELALAV